jgi:hypothetical protein
VIATYWAYIEYFSATTPTRGAAIAAAVFQTTILGLIGFAFPIALLITMNTTSVRNYYAEAI